MKTKKMLSALISAAMFCGTLSALPVSAENGYRVWYQGETAAFSPLPSSVTLRLPLVDVPEEHAGEFCSVSASMTRTGFIVSLKETPAETVKIAGETCKNRGGHWTSAHYGVYPCGELARSYRVAYGDTGEYDSLKATDCYPEQYEEYLGVRPAKPSEGALASRS